jgi:polyferredoxin
MKDIIPDFLTFIFPIIGGIVLLLTNFSWLIIVLLFILIFPIFLCCVCGVVAVVGVKGKREGEREEKEKKRLDREVVVWVWG